MTPESKRLTALADTARRRRRLATNLIALAFVFVILTVLPSEWPWLARAFVSLIGAALLVRLTTRQRTPGDAYTARGYAQHLDARFPQLEDSTSLLLDASNPTPLTQLQRDKTRAQFAQLDHSGQLTATMPALQWRNVAVTWAVAAVLALLASLHHTASVKRDPSAAADATAIQRGRVTLQPPAYLAVPSSTVDTLDFATYEGTLVDWQLTLNRPATSVQLAFHNGETRQLEKQSARRWRARNWRARSSVYRVIVDDANTPAGVFRIDAQPDQAPRIAVAQPEKSVRVVANDHAGELALTLNFSATDDYGITNTQARITLARGNGEQVRFREQAIELDAQWQDDRRQASVTHTFDLLELGMEPGDELYVFAQATDNRTPAPNVGSSDTFIVRWPGPEAALAEPVATLAVPVLPEFFRSQRQIIIDTESLIAQRDDIEDEDFAQRAQALAIDQKLLRLRYGQYLGEEDDSGIGAAQQLEASDDEHDEHDEPEEHDDREHHDHAGHADEPPGAPTPAVGDAQAAIALTAHFHDRAEQATLFEPETRELLRRALAQMWDAELHLRLAEPTTALPYEYAALGFIKEVQQSDRVYVRRTGFRPTPIDEERRLTGELDEVESREIDNDPRLTSQNRRLRTLLDTLTRDATPAAPELSALTDIVRARALIDTAWLPALGAMERLLGDSTCQSCRAELTGALWPRLGNIVPPPSAAPMAVHPLQRAYEVRRREQPGATTP